MFTVWCYRVFPSVDQSSPAFSVFPVKTVAQDWGSVHFDGFPEPPIPLLLHLIVQTENYHDGCPSNLLEGDSFLLLNSITFSHSGPFVFHSHLVAHEDNCITRLLTVKSYT